MQKIEFKSRSIEELWALHEEIASLLMAKLEKRLGDIEGKALDFDGDGARQPRQYPKVYSKFRNPEPPHQTWSGRGKQPHWMRKLLAQGKTMDDFRIVRFQN
jgi:DNA-binding protein H-NS